MMVDDHLTCLSECSPPRVFSSYFGQVFTVSTNKQGREQSRMARNSLIDYSNSVRNINKTERPVGAQAYATTEASVSRGLLTLF